VTVGIPVVASRYRGIFPHRPITLDDGEWHTTAQDFRFNVRYQALRGPIVVTPFVGTDIPSHDYVFYAHAAPVRQLKEMSAGVGVGKLFADPGLVVQGRYSLSLSEGAIDHSRRYSLASLEAAYFLTPSIRLLAMSAGRMGHTGIDLFPDSGRVLPAEVFRHHDQISRESYFNVGGGAAISLWSEHACGEPRRVAGRSLELRLAWCGCPPFARGSREQPGEVPFRKGRGRVTAMQR
jgi:hypothetical protein